MSIFQSPIFAITAPSGTGKNTIINALLQQRPYLAYSVSTTTRKPRKREENGINYWFISKKEFEEKIKKESFIEYAEVLDNYYGTSKKEIERILQNSQFPILDIDIQGAMKLQQSKYNLVCIFILPPSLGELERRLLNRGTESVEQINKRLALAQTELEYKKHFQYSVTNDHLDNAVKSIETIIESEIQEFKK